ncbi:MAG: glycosyltransferase [Candidatus Velthaea sp.]
MSSFARTVSLLIAGAWVGLLVARGRFWDPPCDRLCSPSTETALPAVHVIVPARDEAAVLPRTLPALVAQRYPGAFDITVADDGSDDGTADIVRSLGVAVCAVLPRPAGWAGKVWAMASGVADARARGATPAYWLFTDADIAHDPDALAALVATARAERRDMISQMVELRCESAWERQLIPAFVYFFAKLYPFAWVADDRRATAAAAGGCILLSEELLDAIGGLQAIAGALIDDCALAGAVKARGGRLRLELSSRTRSIRPYDGLAGIWHMVARSAYTQLQYSPLRVAATVAGMLALYIVPPAAFALGLARRDAVLARSGAAGWLLLSASFVPMLRRYRLSPLRAPALPFAALLYTAMTVDSMRRHMQGQGAAWKGRALGPKLT